MTKAFKASRLMGLAALVLGLMAISVTAAQAEPGAYWEVGGTKIEGTSTLLPKINAKPDTPHGTLISKSGATKVEILCSEIKFVNGLLHTLGRATGKIHFSGLSPNGCETLLNGKAAATCRPHSPGAAAGLIETNKLVGLIKLHTLEGGTKDDQVELKPETGLVFVTLTLGTEGAGNECAIGEKIDIKLLAEKAFFLKDCKGEGLVNKTEHLFEEGALSALLFGSNPATIVGSAWGFLEGEHSGQLWSGHPA